VSGRRLQRQDGETLIELLITIVVISIGAVALVAMMTSAVLAADSHRSLAEGEVVLRNYSEAIKQHAADLTPWPVCPAKAQLEPPFNPPGWPTHAILEVRYWVPGAGTDPRTWTTSQSTCTARFSTMCAGLTIAGCDPGLVWIKAHITNNRTGNAFANIETTISVRRNNAP
jgi:type II secretory pathway pseudopilin PulG